MDEGRALQCRAAPPNLPPRTIGGGAVPTTDSHAPVSKGGSLGHPVHDAGNGDPRNKAPAIHTFVLYPGHWQLVGARYAWVKGDETLREVSAQVYVQGHFVWRDHAWVWVPDHYE